jgi:hypothetical protein
MIPWSTFTFADHHFTLFSITHGHIPPSGYYREEENRYNRVRRGYVCTNRRRTAGNGRTRNQGEKKKRNNVNPRAAVCFHWCFCLLLLLWSKKGVHMMSSVMSKVSAGSPRPLCKGSPKNERRVPLSFFPFLLPSCRHHRKSCTHEFPFSQRSDLIRLPVGVKLREEIWSAWFSFKIDTWL